MRTLLLMRHAKSSWDNANIEDHDRPLNARGQDAAARMGRWLAAQNITLDKVILSSATRVQQTWGLVKDELPQVPAAFPDRDLYMAWPDTLLSQIKSSDPKARTILLINHEPSLSNLCYALAQGHIPPDCARAFETFSTAAIAEFQFEDAWHLLGKNSAQFTRFVRPKDLP